MGGVYSLPRAAGFLGAKYENEHDSGTKLKLLREASDARDSKPAWRVAANHNTAGSEHQCVNIERDLEKIFSGVSGYWVVCLTSVCWTCLSVLLEGRDLACYVGLVTTIGPRLTVYLLFSAVCVSYIA